MLALIDKEKENKTETYLLWFIFMENKHRGRYGRLVC